MEPKLSIESYISAEFDIFRRNSTFDGQFEKRIINYKKLGGENGLQNRTKLTQLMS